MGRDDEPAAFPAHTVTVPGFAIGKTEVTNAEYLEFVNATDHVAPSNWTNKHPDQGTENWPVASVAFPLVFGFALT